MRPIRHFLLLVATVLAACTSSSSSSTSPPGAASLTSGPSAIELKVMEFNIEYGGEEVDFASVPKAILASGADVVAVAPRRQLREGGRGQLRGRVGRVVPSVGTEFR